jgi:hypothetical protein
VPLPDIGIQPIGYDYNVVFIDMVVTLFTVEILLAKGQAPSRKAK